VNLGRYSEFTEPLFENGIRNCFSILFWIDVTTAYFVKASVMHKTNFLLLSAVNIGQNKSAWILQLGISGIGSGCSGVSLIVPFFLCWQVRQVWTCCLTS